MPTRERNHPSVWLRYMGEAFLLDCGEGTQRQLALAELSYAKIDIVCITHWHPDHALGLVGLLHTLETESVARTIHVIGPDATRNVNGFMASAAKSEKADIETMDVPQGGGVVRETPYYRIRAFPTLHNVRSYGYVFEEKDRWHYDMDKVERMKIPVRVLEELRQKLVINYGDRRLAIGEVAERIHGKKVVYTGDTLPTENTIEAAKGADLLIHDATYLEKREDKYHSTAEDAARVASAAGVKQLMLIHFSKIYADARAHVAAAKKIFPNTIAAEDLMALKIV